MLYADFLHYVLPHCPNCPHPVAENALKNAAIEFFRKVDLWRVAFPLTGDGATTSFQLGNPPGYIELADIKRIDAVTVAGKRWSVVSRQEADNLEDDGSREDYVYTDDLRTIVFSRAPEDDASIKVRAVMVPNMDSRVMPDIASQWIEGIGFGAVSRLRALPAFADPGLALYARNEFDRAIWSATNSAFKGHSSHRKAVTGHYF